MAKHDYTIELNAHKFTLYIPNTSEYYKEASLLLNKFKEIYKKYFSDEEANKLAIKEFASDINEISLPKSSHTQELPYQLMLRDILLSLKKILPKKEYIYGIEQIKKFFITSSMTDLDVFFKKTPETVHSNHIKANVHSAAM